MKKVGNILWGIVLIVLGIIIGLNATGVTHINIFFRGWWTLIIIIPSIIGLIKNDSKLWSFIWLCIGVVLLLSAQNILSFSLISKLIFPFILVVIGVSLIFKNVAGEKIKEKVKKMNNENLENEEYCATFSSQNADYSGQEFKGANLDAVFGSVVLDLQKAIIKEDPVIYTSSIFAGTTILVPNNVNVKVKSTSIFGGVNNKVLTQNKENLPTIYISAFCLFGGADIK